MLSACASQPIPPQTIHERLAGQTLPQQQVTLRNICLTEAGWKEQQLIEARTIQFGGRRARNNLPYITEVSRLKAICREMVKTYAAEEN